ncbi:MAG: triose-phosphate isomerase [Armatimonadetes bacterium RBG_16_58_9]|nr:MAG: triose-phosphate isomerase [Armatimonadetes bacterium RBG_16_58_9]
MPRGPFIAGNWKMNKTVTEGLALVDELKGLVADVNDVDIAVCPTFVSLLKIGEAIKGSNITLGGQCCFWQESGAWTSQIAAGMLKDVGCEWVIIGHSETRGRFGTVDAVLGSVLSYFGESDTTVNLKAKAAFAAGLTPIIACGELLAEREAGKADQVIAEQMKVDLAGFTHEQAMKMVIAYEPVWAIGTGQVCDAAEADRVCGVIRNIVSEMYGEDAAAAVRIQYGGSVKPDNAAELLHKENIDGALVGGASLVASDFAAIVKAAR